ncbi:hypothetical protein RF11_11888 [Thelohanellus kitauei]|uniref:Uncharacterized protein n=1 Tax=Thelohanellus kitauei TaxID=669202 RepID=A0A0C2N6G4_THEKT|nr:hypothetical protein RF11_11888 [Thelohanellus kitauei]
MRPHLSEFTAHRIYIDVSKEAWKTIKIEFILRKEATQSIVTQISVQFWNSAKLSHYMQSTISTHVVIPYQTYVELLNKEFMFANPERNDDYLILTVQNFSLKSIKFSEVVYPVYTPVVLNDAEKERRITENFDKFEENGKDEDESGE